MRRYFPTIALVLAACGPGVYTRAEVVYAEPAQYVYVEPVDHVVVVSREVLVSRGYQVYRVEDDGPTRVIWATRRRRDRARVRDPRARARLGPWHTREAGPRPSQGLAPPGQGRRSRGRYRRAAPGPRALAVGTGGQ